MSKKKRKMYAKDKIPSSLSDNYKPKKEKTPQELFDNYPTKSPSLTDQLKKLRRRKKR